MKLRRYLAAIAAVIALVAYAQYWISQHPGVRFIGDGNNQTSSYISASRHYRAWPVVLANLTKHPVVKNAKGIHFSHNLDDIWSVTVERQNSALPISSETLKSLKPMRIWKPSETVRSGWISGIYVDQQALDSELASKSADAEIAFGVYKGPGKKFYLIYPMFNSAEAGVTDANG